MIRFLLCVLFVAVIGQLADGRQRTQKTVQTERREATRKIERTRKELTKNEQSTRRELLNLQVLEGEIRDREAEAERLAGQVAGLQRESRKVADSISANESRLAELRQSYGKAVRALHRQRQQASGVSYIFSSTSFQQARSRMRYLKELGEWQKDKTEDIAALKASLEERHRRLDTLTSRVAMSADSLAAVRRVLGERKHKADAAVGSLKRQSRNLQRVLEEQQRLVKQLDDELDRIIEAEAEARRKAEAERKKGGKETPEAGPSKPKAEETVAPDRLTAPFEQCKGKLPWPLDRKATVTSTFGRHTHETLERVTVQNNGVDFETSPGASARAVYDGTVSMIIVMEGYGNVVLVRHGEYLTVYAGLSDLRVRKGDKVEGGQLIGTVFSDPSDGNRTKLHFEVRHEKTKLDPMLWLKP